MIGQFHDTSSPPFEALNLVTLYLYLFDLVAKF